MTRKTSVKTPRSERELSRKIHVEWRKINLSYVYFHSRRRWWNYMSAKLQINGRNWCYWRASCFLHNLFAVNTYENIFCQFVFTSQLFAWNVSTNNGCRRMVGDENLYSWILNVERRMDGKREWSLERSAENKIYYFLQNRNEIIPG